MGLAERIAKLQQDRLALSEPHKQMLNDLKLLLPLLAEEEAILMEQKKDRMLADLLVREAAQPPQQEVPRVLGDKVLSEAEYQAELLKRESKGL